MPEVDYLRLEKVLRGFEGIDIRKFDAASALEGPVETGLFLSSIDSRAVAIGPLITVTDREIRRAVTIFGSEPYHLGDPGNRPRPISPTYGGLQVSDTAIGSVHLLLIAYGAVLKVLTSKPLQALTAAITLSQGSGSIRVWRRQRDKDPLAGLSARDALNVLKEFGGLTDRLMQQSRPNLEIRIPETVDEAAPTTGLKPPIPSDRPPESVEGSSWRRITYIRKYPDGTEDIIYIDA